MDSTWGLLDLVSVTQNHVQNSGPKFRLFIPDWIREKFDSDFWSPGRTLIFYSSGTFWAQSQQRRPTDQAANWFEQKNVGLVWFVAHWPMPEIFRGKSRSFVLNLYILPKKKLRGRIIGSFGRFFRMECFGSENPKFWITVYWELNGMNFGLLSEICSSVINHIQFKIS
jgi:hypothetical protein